MEPPGSHVPARRPGELTLDSLSPIRLGALAAAAALAASSRGDVLVLGVVLGIGAASVGSGAAAVLAGIAVLIRWGSPSLGALAGGQAVLGAAGTVGPPAAALSAWCAALAIVLAAAPAVRGGEHGAAPARIPRRALAPALVAVPFGLAAAAFVAGPGPGGDLWVRVGASVVAIALARMVGSVRVSTDRLAVAAGVVALAGVVASVFA